MYIDAYNKHTRIYICTHKKTHTFRYIYTSIYIHAHVQTRPEEPTHQIPQNKGARGSS